MTARHTLAMIVAMVLAGLSGSASAEDSPNWQQRLSIPEAREGNVYFTLDWDAETGAQLRLVQANGTDAVTVQVDPKQPRVLRSSATSAQGEPMRDARYDRSVMPKLDISEAEAVLKIRPHAWTLYVEGLPAVQWPVPFEGALQVWQPAAQIPVGSDEDSAWFQRTAPINFSADFMVVEGQENPLGTWKPETGNWHIHSVLDMVMEEAPTDRIKQRPLEAERSPNFYSLKGNGDDAIILNGYEFYDDYELSAAVETQPGEGGLIFLYQGPRDYYKLVLITDDDQDTSARVQLWRHSSRQMPRVAMLREVDVPITAHQWVRPKVRVWNEQVRVYLDDSQLFTVDDELPVGGRFGLYANGERERRFDDVEVRSVQELDLSDTHRLRFHTLATRGEFFERSSLMGLVRTSLPRSEELPVHASPSDQWLVVGRESDLPHVFAATIQPANWGDVGLVLGYRGADTPHLRFVYGTDLYSETFTLQRVAPGSTTDLQTFRLPMPKDDRRKPKAVRLMADATAPNEVRIYRDGELVFVHHPEDEFIGASGIYVGAEVPAIVRDLTHKGHREHIYRNQYEKNRNYVVDPFMRHWSSPEGQWVTDKDGITWHKSDFFGRFELAMPYVEGSTIHLGVPEDRDVGAVTLSFHDGQVVVTEPGEAEDAKEAQRADMPEAVMTIAANPPESIAERLPDYTVHYEGYWVWVTHLNQEIVRHRLARPLSGRRMRIEGFSTEHLSICLVDRYNVKDYLFNRAPTDWVRNGGTWEIINRFQCDPRWSHMNGEAPDNIGALWAKYDFSGDFCIEMYAGIRHGSWYQRCGDLNITIMNDQNSPSSGYTVTTTGWDRDQSQLWTRLLRDGEELARTDKYLVPRIREGNVRQYHDPLLADGRDVHGAWYYLKLRRIGNTLEYWFDNERIFQIEERSTAKTVQYWSDGEMVREVPKSEANPLTVGGMGIWTYMNSMMVARVKVAAEKITPRPVPATSPRARLSSLQSHVDPGFYDRILDGDQPAQRLLPTNWKPAEDASFVRLDWYESEDFRPYFVATNTLGNGRMQTAADLPPMKLSDLAGFAFDFKRTPGTQVNFHYSIGVMEEGKFQPRRRFYHHLGGPRNSDANFTEVGSTQVPETRMDFDWHAYGDWTQVRAWMPDTHLGLDINALYVKVDGFGILQSSYEMQGLTGNDPGVSYAVIGFAPITLNPPQLIRNESHSKKIPRAYVLMWPDSRRQPIRSNSFNPLARNISGDSRQGFNHRRLRTLFKGAEGSGISKVTDTDLYWVTLPKETEFQVSWDPAQSGAILIKAPAELYDRDLFSVAVSARGEQLQTESVDHNTIRAWLPRGHAWEAATGEPLQIDVAGQVNTLDWSQRKPERPVLVKVDGYSPFFLNFENLSYEPHVMYQDGRMSIPRHDPVQGAYLDIWNQAWNQRLLSSYTTSFSLSRYPLLRLRYRGDDMSRVTLSLGRSNVAFSEERANAPQVTLSPAMADLDGRWHTWMGRVSDSNEGDAFSANRFLPGSMKIASIDPKDQTGAHSELDLDELTFAPAVKDAQALAFTPTYFDYGGVKSIFYSLHPGPLDYDSLDDHARTTLKWIHAAPGQPIQPNLDGRENGIYHIFVKAIDSDSRESRVSSLPFIYDTKPLPITSNFLKSNATWTNGQVLRIVADSQEGAPIDLQQLTIAWDGKAIRPHSAYNTLTHSATGTVVNYNWPFELRNYLDRMADGDSGTLTISNIVDGAGNQSSDISVPIKINHAQDKIGPTLLRARMPSNIAFHSDWYGAVTPAPMLKPASRNGATVKTKFGDEPFLVTTSHGSSGVISIERKNWTLNESPYLALWLRRPTIGENDNTGLRLVVRYEDRRHQVIYVTPTNNSPMQLDPALTWAAGDWQSLQVDLREMISKRAKDERFDMPIERIDIQRTATENDQPLHLMAVTAYGPWRADDTIQMSGFDASGVGGLSWDYVGPDMKVVKSGTSSETSVKPATLGLPPIKDAWLMLHLVDHAGNRSLPLRVPYQP